MNGQQESEAYEYAVMAYALGWNENKKLVKFNWVVYSNTELIK